MKYESYFKKSIDTINKFLDKVMPPESANPGKVHEAMRYSVFPGGKRFRPVLTMIACEAAGGRAEDALYPAAAVELIHTYSLIHDDLPALDNDEMRRGKLTCHKKYGEAIAILAGDGLLTLAFQVAAMMKPAETAVKVLAELSTEAGSYGMIGGQVADLAAADGVLDVPALDYISIHKTGKLIKASAVAGALAAGASEKVCGRILKFGELIGMAFQSIDDLIDGDGYMRLMKAQEIRDKARDLIAKAKREIKPLGAKADQMHQMADFLVKRIPRRSNASVGQ